MIERAFVGRAAELAALTTAFADADAPWLFLVEGPAGIGKSRLIAHFARAVRCRVVLVTGTEDAQAHPRYLVDDIVEQLTDDSSPADPDIDVRPAASSDDVALTAGVASSDVEAVSAGAMSAMDHAASMADSAGSTVVAPGGAVAGRGSEGRSALGTDADLARWARRALGRVETLLVVDDVQWADPESVRVLTFLIRNRPPGGFRLLLAFRDGGCPAAITRLLRAPQVAAVRVRVPPFTESDVAELLPGERPRRRARLLSASQGNPLYLSLLAELPEVELDRALCGENPDPACEDYAGLDRTIRAELAQLPESERLVAQAAAVCGVPPDLELLCATADLPVQTVAEAVDGLVRRGIAGVGLPAATVPGAVDGLAGRGSAGVGDGAVSFAHPLVRTAAYRLAGHGWRAMAHRRAALALRARDAPMPVRARHLEHALLGPDETGGTELRRAAEQVLADAPAVSARWLTIAQRIAPAVADPLADALALGRALLLSGAAEQAGVVLAPVTAAGPHQLEALLLAARCARMLARVDQARALLATAATLPRRPGDGPVQLELAILELQDHQDAEGQARLRALFDSDAVDDPAVRAAATTLRCLGLVADGQLAAATDLYRDCARAFDLLTDTDLREVVHAVPALGWCAYFLDHDAEGLAHLDRGIEVSRRFGRSYAMAELHTVRAYSLAKLGRLTDAITAADDATDAATTFHYPDLLSFAAAVKLRTLQFTADDTAITAQWHTVAALPRPAMRWWRQVVETTLTETARPLGLPAPPPHLPPTTRPGPLHPTHLARAAHAAITTGDLPTAATLITRAEAACHLPFPAASASTGAASAADRAGSASGESSSIERGQGLGSQVGVAALARAEYSVAIGDLAVAATAADAAIAAFARAGMVVSGAQAELLAGVIAGRRGDFGLATSRFASARAVFAAAGAHRLLAETTTAQRRLAGGQRVGAPAALTRREREVADLAAQGHSNRDIAAHLYLSPRTVEDHLSRVLRKLGLTGRAGIARKLDELDRVPG
ncbi:AAA family ATPase [Nocardia sp. NPDC058176]|uniref:helix-turn-helix transcriptional regulator n=1 Tax=Nocardia sp. NPDC058176 TaxID=3346368 RepID=UPI0036DEE18C